MSVPVLSGTASIDRSVIGLLSSERKIIPYNSRPVPILAIKDLPQKQKNNDDEAQDVMTSEEEHVSCLVRVERKEKIPTRSEEMV